MEITEVKVFPINEAAVRAYVDITFDACFVVRGIKIIRGNKGHFLQMPQRKTANGDYVRLAYPLDKKTRQWIEDKVFAAYQPFANEPVKRQT